MESRHVVPPQARPREPRRAGAIVAVAVATLMGDGPLAAFGPAPAG